MSDVAAHLPRSSQAFGARGARARRPLEAHAILLALRGCLPMAGLEHVSCSMPANLCVYREHTPGVKALGRLAYTSMVATHRDIHMMDKQDATDMLTFVVVHLVTPAAKRAVEEEAATERDECVAMHVGAALAAERENSRAVR